MNGVGDEQPQSPWKCSPVCLQQYPLHPTHHLCSQPISSAANPSPLHPAHHLCNQPITSAANTAKLKVLKRSCSAFWIKRAHFMRMPFFTKDGGVGKAVVTEFLLGADFPVHRPCKPWQLQWKASHGRFQWKEQHGPPHLACQQCVPIILSWSLVPPIYSHFQHDYSLRGCMTIPSGLPTQYINRGRKWQKMAETTHNFLVPSRGILQGGVLPMSGFPCSGERIFIAVTSWGGSGSPCTCSWVAMSFVFVLPTFEARYMSLGHLSSHCSWTLGGELGPCPSDGQLTNGLVAV